MTSSERSITSKHYSNYIDSTIVNLVRTLMVEQGIDHSTALKQARIILQLKVNVLLEESDTKYIKKVVTNTKKLATNNEYAQEVYKLLSILGLT